MYILHGWYIGGMKIKTSVTLSREVVALIDKHAEGETNRSAFIELAVRTYLQILQQRERDQRDLRTINRLSKKLNKEAEDVLDYQRGLPG
jgi:metal-responsive CopG/Arc/MetJ family transcriptional regulator